MIPSVPYQYHNLPIGGGGYVTGFVMHDRVPDLLYARTDIGGIYRFDFTKTEWISLGDGITHEDLAPSFPLALALDPNHPERLYMACGLGRIYSENGWFYRSDDYGKSFVRFPLPCRVHGNDPGRGTGKRMVVDPNDENVIYFATQTAGLLRSSDRGETWDRIDIASASHPVPETNLTFVFLSDDSNIIVVGTNGEANHLTDDMRGPSLYVSYNRGTAFKELKQPKVKPGDYTSPMGFVGHRYAFTGRYLFIAMNHTVPGTYFRWEGYSSDSARMIGGKVLRYELVGGQLTNVTDVTPELPQYGISSSGLCECGFGGIAVSPATPGRVLLSTLDHRKGGEMILESYDYGDSWRLNLKNLETGNMTFHTPYMRPENNGGGSLIHWLTDICADPFNPNRAWFNTGTGIFWTHNLFTSNYNWEDCCSGLENTVHLGVFAPTGGRCQVLDACGDLGGFAFTNLTEYCTNTFCDFKKDRFITALTCDYVDQYPNICIASVRGNWSGKTTGGIIKSTNGGGKWELLPEPRGLNPQIDRLLDRIDRPNCNSGWAAISADGETIVWALAFGQKLPVEALVFTKDNGETWKRSRVTDRNGISVMNTNIKPFADRTDPNRFYAFDSNGGMYISLNGGESFRGTEVPAEFPEVNLASLEGRFQLDIRGVSGEVGTFVLALGKEGLWKIHFLSEALSVEATRITAKGDKVYAVGLGICPGNDSVSAETGPSGKFTSAEIYAEAPKALYIAANLSGIYGFYRSYDFGTSWECVNTGDQCFGQIRSIDGDKKVPGRFYIATGTRGLLVGEEKTV